MQRRSDAIGDPKGLSTQEAPSSEAPSSEEIFSPQELCEIRRFYFGRLDPGERRILAAFESLLREDAAPEARLAAFAELRRSRRLRDYVEATEACRLAAKAEALGLEVRAARPRRDAP